MTRFAVLLALASVSLLPARAPAQPAVPGPLQVVDAKAEKDKLQWTQSQVVPVAKEVPVEVVKNGMKFIEKRTVTVYEVVPVTRTAELKTIKATDAAGKAIDADKLAELLKDST